MSFGFSIGDFVLLIQIARTTFRNCQEAGDEYIEVANAVRCLHSVLKTLQAEAQRPESKIFKQHPASTAQLLETAEGCKNVLDSLGYILAKYEGLKVDSQAGAGKKFWQLFRFGSKAEELVVIRSKLDTYTSTLSIVIDTLHIQATDRVETKIDGGFAELSGQFAKMRKEILAIAIQARSEERRSSTMSTLTLSTYAGDEKIVWRDFRRELLKRGFKSQSLEKHKHVLLAYMIKLDQSGLLYQNDVMLEADNANPWWTKKMFTDTMSSLADLQLIEESPSRGGLPQAIIDGLNPMSTVDKGNEVQKTDNPGKDGSDQKSGLHLTEVEIGSTSNEELGRSEATDQESSNRDTDFTSLFSSDDDSDSTLKQSQIRAKLYSPNRNLVPPQPVKRTPEEQEAHVIRRLKRGKSHALERICDAEEIVIIEKRSPHSRSKSRPYSVPIRVQPYYGGAYRGPYYIRRIV
jgi:hypothetical protein